MDKLEIRSELLTCSPLFQAHWESIAPEGQFLVTNADLNELLWAFARHLLELYQDSETNVFPAVIATIDRLYKFGEPDTKDNIIKLLGCIGYDWWDSGVNPNEFAQLLPVNLQPYCVAGVSHA